MAADLALLVAAVFAFRVAATLACVVAPRLAFRVAFASEPSERASLALAVARRLLALAWLVARPANIVAAFASGLAEVCCGLAKSITSSMLISRPANSVMVRLLCIVNLLYVISGDYG